MNNKILVKDISNKNILITNRHSSIDSTKSSLRVKKIKLHNEFIPFKMLKNPNKKNILNYPIFLSLFTKNYSFSEKDKKMENNSTNNINLNYPSLKNNIKQNELLLPKTKKIVSRNDKGLFMHSFSPINSVVKSSILNHNNFSIQSSLNISKHIIKKLNYSPLLINFSKKTDSGIQVLKNYNYNLNNNSISNSTLEQEISAIKSPQNSSGKNIYNLNINDNKKLNIPFHFFTPRDNGGHKKNIILPLTKLNFKEINKIKKNFFSEENNNNINEIKNNNLTINNKFHKFNKLEKITDLLEINKNKNVLDKDINSQSNIINKKKKSIIDIKKNKKDKNKQIKNESFENIDKNKKKVKKSENENSEIKEIYPKNLMIEEEKLKKVKVSKFYLVINNKKTIKKYNNNYFLNDLNKVLAKKSINNKINAKIFLTKTEILVNTKEIINKTIQKQESKLKTIETPPRTQIEKEKIMSSYFKDIYSNKKKVKKYYEKKMFLGKIKFYFNCCIHYTLKDYIFHTTQFDQVSLTNKLKKKFKKQGSVKQDGKTNSNDINNIKRQNTFTKKSSKYNDLEDAFTIKKTTNNFKIDLKVKNNLGNLIIIHNCILKSLYFYNERYFMKKDFEFAIKNNKKNIYKKKKFDLKSFSRHASKKLEETQNVGLNSAKVLIKILKKKNTLNLSQKTIGSELLFNKKLIKKSPTLLDIEDFTKNLRNQLSKRARKLNIEDFSILQRKNFYKKTRDKKGATIIFKNDIKNSGKEIHDLNYNKDKDNINDEDLNTDEIYFELIKFIIEGQNKNFEKYFEKNKKYIEINQDLYDGNTLLILCAKEGNYYITKFLCEQKAEVNWQNHSGNTALHYAVGKQFYAIADILTRYGAREDIKNIKGLTPWDCIEHNIE